MTVSTASQAKMPRMIGGTPAFRGRVNNVRRATAMAKMNAPSSQSHARLASRLQRALANGGIGGLSEPWGLIQVPNPAPSPPIQEMNFFGISSSSLAGCFLAYLIA